MLWRALEVKGRRAAVLVVEGPGEPGVTFLCIYMGVHDVAQHLYPFGRVFKAGVLGILHPDSSFLGGT